MADTIVLKVDRDDPISWAWMPHLLNRIGKFCDTYETEMTANEAIDLVRTWFAIGDKRMGVWICLHEEKGLIGHLFATTEPIGHTEYSYVLIRQAEIDKGVTLRKEALEAFRQVKEWTKALSLDRLVIVTHRSHLAMARKWGFSFAKSVMSLKLSAEG